MAFVHDVLTTKGKKAAQDENIIQRDVLEAASAYMSDEDTALSFAYAGWAQCALPHRKIERTPTGLPWEVSSGQMRLVVEPGRRPTGKDGSGPLEWVSIPFGAYPRLILFYLQTQAIRTSCREVELGNSWRDWMTRIGVSWGGNTGRSVREQAELLSRCRLTFHMPGGDGRTGLLNQAIVDGAIFIESPQAERQGRLSLESVKLSEQFFNTLKKHPLPLEESAIKALANNSAALDAYMWLAYRLHSLHAPRLVTWQALKAQHGIGYNKLADFKFRFSKILELATAVYQEAKIEIVDAGVMLKPSRPPVGQKLIALRAPHF